MPSKKIGQIFSEVTFVPIFNKFHLYFIRYKTFLAKSCHALAQLLITEEKALERGNSTSAAVAEIAAKVEIPSLLMKSCQWGNWEACTSIGVLSLEVKSNLTRAYSLRPP